MRRVNTFDVTPRSRRDKLALIDLMDASTACWNQIQYARRQAFLRKKDETEGNAAVSELKHAVKTAATQEEYRQKYIQQLSSSIPQQLVQKN